MKAIAGLTIVASVTLMACGGATIGDDVVLQEAQDPRASSPQNPRPGGAPLPTCVLSSEAACKLLPNDPVSATALRELIEYEARARDVRAAIRSSCVEIAAVLDVVVPAADEAAPACDLASAALSNQTPRISGLALPTTECLPLERAGCSPASPILLGETCRASRRTAAGGAPSPDASEPLGAALAKLVADRGDLDSLMRAIPQGSVVTAASKLTDACAAQSLAGMSSAMVAALDDGAKAVTRIAEAFDD